MGMPSINIVFTEKANESIKRGSRGIVALILKDTIPAKNPFTVQTVKDIPENISKDNQMQITFALMGYQNSPKKIICYVVPSTAADYTVALEYLETERFDYLAAPTAETDGQVDNIVSWVKYQRNNKRMYKAVLPNIKADDEGIINFTTKDILSGGKTYTAEQYCSRIAGLIAGTPLKISCTYAPLDEVEDCERRSWNDMNAAVDTGEFIIFNDGSKVKVARGVNSLTTTNLTKGKQFKKIKIVEALDMIHDDIIMAAQDNYLGKYPNNYDSKCILLSAIGDYFEQLMIDKVVSTANAGIDIDAQRKYLKDIGVLVDDMSDEEIKEENTGDKVFLYGSIKILDAVEDIDLPITI